MSGVPELRFHGCVNLHRNQACIHFDHSVAPVTQLVSSAQKSVHALHDARLQTGNVIASYLL